MLMGWNLYLLNNSTAGSLARYFTLSRNFEEGKVKEALIRVSFGIIFSTPFLFIIFVTFRMDLPSLLQ